MWSTFILWLKLSTEWSISNFKSSPHCSSYVNCFPLVWQHLRELSSNLVDLIYVTAVTLLSWKISTNNIICVWNFDIYTLSGPLQGLWNSITYIYFVLSVIWRKATKDGINSFQNRVYIFAKMTKGVNFPWMLLLLSKAYPPRRESLCWMWRGWATPRFKEMMSV